MVWLVVSIFWICLKIQYVSLLGYISLSKYSTVLTKWCTREEQMEWVTHPGVLSVLHIGRVQMAMVTRETRALRGTFDGWYLPTATVRGGKTANPVWFMMWTRKQDGATEQTLQAVSRSLGWSHRAQVRGITHQRLFYRTGHRGDNGEMQLLQL